MPTGTDPCLTRDATAPVTSLAASLDAELSHVEASLEQLCAKEPTIARLTTAPGVGLVVAAAFVSVIDEAKRFHSAHQLESYPGLVPSEETSGGRDKRRLGAITKCGNPYLRSLLVQAAWCILRGRTWDLHEETSMPASRPRPTSIVFVVRPPKKDRISPLTLGLTHSRGRGRAREEQSL